MLRRPGSCRNRCGEVDSAPDTAGAAGTVSLNRCRNQQMTFDVQYFPRKDCGKTNPHVSTLYRVLGRTPRPAQFTNTSNSESSKSGSVDVGQ